MKIRNAEIKDIDKIHNLGCNVEEFNTTEEVVVFWPKKILENCVKSKTDFILVAENNDEIVGFTIANYSPVFKKATIENVFVRPDSRDQKIGKQLIQELTSKLNKINCEYICILTENNNTCAIGFYEKMGFNRGIDCAWMDKVLSKDFKR